MPNPKDFEMNFRPESYWDNAVSGLANIKGEMRRRILSNAFDGGDFNFLPSSIFSDELSDSERMLTTSIDPAFMGGEYLPPYDSGEIEIARVSLQSVTWDVISIRAIKIPQDRLCYRVVDEYETPFKSRPLISLEPFSFKELVSFIDSVENGHGTRGLTAVYRDYNYEIIGPGRSELEGLVNFVRVSSLFYPDLESWYETEAMEWFTSHLAELEFEEET